MIDRFVAAVSRDGEHRRPTYGALVGVTGGAIAGVVSLLMTRFVYFTEDLYERLPIHWMWWPTIGGAIVGIGGWFVPPARRGTHVAREYAVDPLELVAVGTVMRRVVDRVPADDLPVLHTTDRVRAAVARMARGEGRIFAVVDDAGTFVGTFSIEEALNAVGRVSQSEHQRSRVRRFRSRPTTSP